MIRSSRAKEPHARHILDPFQQCQWQIRHDGVGEQQLVVLAVGALQFKSGDAKATVLVVAVATLFSDGHVESEFFQRPTIGLGDALPGSGHVCFWIQKTS